MRRNLVGMMLGLIVVLWVSTASGNIILYDDCSSVSANWTSADVTMTSDGDVLRMQSSAGGYAILPWGTTADENTMVFDFKIASPGLFLAGYVSNPGEGLLITSTINAKASRNSAQIMELQANTWYTAAIYSYGAAGYQAFWIAQGKDVNMWSQSKNYEVGSGTWSGTNRSTFYTYTTTGYPNADWQVDNIRVNSGLDLTPAPEPVSLSLLGIGGLAMLLRRKK
ncbi:MAG: PEP-CTERM sorting domain-containing protein [Phycisphaerae bacterium]